MISAEIRNVDEHHTRGIFDNLYIVIWRKIAEISVVGVANDLQFMTTHFPEGFGFLTICENTLTPSDFGEPPAFQLQVVVSQREQNYLVRALVLECSEMIANLARTNFNVTGSLNVRKFPKPFAKSLDLIADEIAAILGFSREELIANVRFLRSRKIGSGN